MVIEHYRHGRIVVDSSSYTSDVILWPEGVDDTWWRREAHRLCREDLEPVLSKHPAVLIIGTGSTGALSVPDEVLKYMQERCSEVYVEPTEQACARYNDLCDGPTRVAAALHLTC